MDQLIRTTIPRIRTSEGLLVHQVRAVCHSEALTAEFKSSVLNVDVTMRNMNV